MSPCDTLRPVLEERASGAVADPEEATLLGEHLACCPSCRAELDACASLYAAVRLSASSASQASAARDRAGLAAGALRTWKDRRRRRVTAAVLGAGFAAAAVAALIAVGPAFGARRMAAFAPLPVPGAAAELSAEAGAREPAGAPGALEPADVALAALDEADPE